MKKLKDFVREYPDFAATIIVLLVAIGLSISGMSSWAQWIITIFSSIIALKLSIGMIKDLMGGKYGIDILAITAIAATLIVGEYWATIIIVLMLTGGEALEDYAAERAKRELTALLERAPTTAHKVATDGTVTDTPIDHVAVGDILRVLPGEVIPVDGVVTKGDSELDESSLTGESVPVAVGPGEEVMSGAVNGASPLEIKAIRDAKNSQYAEILELVKSASEDKSPFVRLADRYAVPFTLISYAIAGFAWWQSGDAVRFAQVLVVATPCPLLLGAPIAMISGMSRAAKHGVIIKSGGILEQLARVQSAAFDKTGTLTNNALEISHIDAKKISEDELLQLAAGAEQDSTHMTARAIVDEAVRRKLPFDSFDVIEEVSGKGIRATKSAEVVLIGRPTFLIDEGISKSALPGTQSTAVHIARNGKYVGAIYFADTVRSESKDVIERLRGLGVQSFAMVTGDSSATANEIAAKVGIENVYAECLPKDKLEIVSSMQPRPVMMTGDGLNDAPVLASSDVGIAMGAKGATAASESADVVILLDDISKVGDAVAISKNTIRIALQSILVGIALSIVLMILAAAGRIPAVVGAGLQEVVDVVVIINALRAHRD